MVDSSRRRELFERHRWLAFVLPYGVFVALGSCEPGTAEPTWWGGDAADYPWFYAVRLLATVAAVIFVWPAWKAWPWKLSAWALPVGVVGGLMWVGLCRLNLEARYLPSLGLGWVADSGVRSGFDPFEHFASRSAATVFLAVRFAGLVLVVPVIEEFFLRLFVLRLATDEKWWEVPFGRWDTLGVTVMMLVAVSTHPAELLAAVVWFSLITAMMLKTRLIWDCVVAHALSNLVLGLYVVNSGDWRLM